jgi:hypothetical protein
MQSLSLQKILYKVEFLESPVQQLRDVCTITLLGIAVLGKYPLSKDYTLEVFGLGNACIMALYFVHRYLWVIKNQNHVSFRMWGFTCRPLLWGLLFLVAAEIMR